MVVTVFGRQPDRITPTDSGEDWTYSKGYLHKAQTYTTAVYLEFERGVLTRVVD